MQEIATYEKTIYETQKDGVIIGLYRFSDRTKIITGTMLPNVPNVKYVFEGEWITHKKYGLQFKAEYFTEDISTKESVIKFLSSRLIKGIGLKTAQKIVDRFGDDTIKVLDNDIHEVLRIKGFPKSKFMDFKISYEMQRGAKDVILRLSKYGVSVKVALNVYSKFKEKTMEMISKEPYKLSLVEGISFPTADRLGPDNYEYEHSYDRFLVCARYVLNTNASGVFAKITGNNTSGSNGMQKDEFGKVMLALLKRNTLDGKFICDMTIKMLNDKSLVYVKKNNEIYFYLPGMFRIERESAKAIEHILVQPNMIKDYKKYKTLAIKKINYSFDDDQLSAVDNVFNHNISIITGMPGTGKTTVIDLIATIYHEMFPKNRIYLVAPSGRASARIRETVDYDYVSVSTIHMFLGIQVDEINDIEKREDLFDNSLIVADESSMIDSRLFYRLVSAIGSNCKLVLSGDIEQLESVGSGAVFRDLIESGCIPVTYLKNIYRQNNDNVLKDNIYKIREGNTDLVYTDDFKFIEEDEPSLIEDKLIQLYIEKANQYGIENVMLLSPFKKNEAGVYNLNVRIQELLNPEGPEELRGIYKFRVNDIVMQIKNDYSTGIMNGDIGRVIDIFYKDGDKCMSVLFGKIKKLYNKENLDELHLAYAYTVHKAQGSENKHVICCCHSMHSVFLKRNMFYTAISRASEDVTLVGQRSALEKAIVTKNTENRITVLKDLLKLYNGEFSSFSCKNGEL